MKAKTIFAAMFGVMMVCGGGCTAMISIPFALLRSSDVATMALERARSEPAVVQALGEPIEMGLLVQGSVSREGSGGNAELSVPISGPKGSAMVEVTAVRKSGKWTLTQVSFDR